MVGCGAVGAGVNDRFSDLTAIVSIGGEDGIYGIGGDAVIGGVDILTIFSDNCELAGSDVGVGEDIGVLVCGGEITVPLMVIVGALFSSFMPII